MGFVCVGCRVLVGLFLSLYRAVWRWFGEVCVWFGGAASYLFLPTFFSLPTQIRISAGSYMSKLSKSCMVLSPLTKG